MQEGTYSDFLMIENNFQHFLAVCATSIKMFNAIKIILATYISKEQSQCTSTHKGISLFSLQAG